MKIQLRFFASIREALQTESELINLPENVKTVADVRAFLINRGGVWAEVLGEDKVLHMAYDHRITSPEKMIAEGCVVAFFPPVTGG